MKRRINLALIIIAGMVMLSCSHGTDSPVMPATGDDLTFRSESASAASRNSWGQWAIEIDTQTWEVTLVPIRGAQYTVDVVTFLQPPQGNPANLSIKVTDTSQWFTDGILGVEVGLRHPFPGLDEYTGFDVYGVFITPGSLFWEYDGDVVSTNGGSEPVLLNSDGYTRWMNPTEFPDMGTILDFTPGKLGNQDMGLFASTINGYKYFADGLEKGENVGEFLSIYNNFVNRGCFKPGSFNQRDYVLKFPIVGGSPEITFQYAVIASWVPPDWTLSGSPDALDVPGDFPIEANAGEAFYADIKDNSQLWYSGGLGGGYVNLQVEVFDWGVLEGGTVTDQIHQIILDSEWITLTDYVIYDQAYLEANASPGNSTISSVYNIDLQETYISDGFDKPVLLVIESTDPDSFDPGTGIPANDARLASYYRIDIPVGTEIPDTLEIISPNGGETFWMAMSHEITWDPGATGITDVTLEWSTDNFVSDINSIIDSTENDGTHLWLPIPNVETDTARVRVRNVSGGASDASDGDFSIALPVWLDFQAEVEVDTTTVNFATWTPRLYEKWMDEFSPAISQDSDGMAHIVWHGEGVTAIQRFAYEPTIRSMDGDSWSGEGDFLHTEGYLPQDPFRSDNMKVAASDTHVPTTFAAIRFRETYFCRDVDRWINFATYFSTCSNPGPAIFENCELMADDDYLYLVADGWKYASQPFWDGPGIYSMRTPTPAPPDPFECNDETEITDFGEISHVRSWAFHDDTLVMAIFTTDGEIKLMKQTDPDTDTWDDTEIIFDGTEYTDCVHPSIVEDGEGRLIAIWTGQENSSGKYHILSSMKETTSSEWTEPVIAAISDTEFEDQHVTASQELALLPTGDSEYLILIGYEVGGEVYTQISPKDLWAFLPAQLVSAEGDETRDPDTFCPGLGYSYDALFAWSFEAETDNWDIKFRNGDFETP